MEDEESKVRAIEAVTGSGGVNLGLLMLRFFCGLYGSGHERGKYFCCERSRFWVSLKKTHEIEVKSINSLTLFFLDLIFKSPYTLGGYIFFLNCTYGL
jgi:hypothetical protein